MAEKSSRRLDPTKPIGAEEQAKHGDLVDKVEIFSDAGHYIGVYDNDSKRIKGGTTSIGLTTYRSEVFKEVDLSTILEDEHAYDFRIVDPDTKCAPEDLAKAQIVAVWDVQKGAWIYSIDLDRRVGG
jgi:hypothetical protein